MAGCSTEQYNRGHQPVRLMSGFAVVALLATALSSSAVGGPWQSTEPDDAVNEIQRLAQGIPSDRKTILTLESFRASIAAKQFESAAEELKKLQTADPESMVPVSDDSDTFVPLYRAVFDSWLSLPAEYRTRFTESAAGTGEKAFAAVLRDGRLDQLPAFILKSVGTTASVKAHLVAARLHIDRGNELAARLWLSPIRHRNINDEFRATAQQVLDSLSPEDTVQSGSSRTPASESAKQQPLPRQFLWQYRPLTSPQLRRQIDTFIAAAGTSKVVLQSSWNSESENDVLFRKTMRGVAAVDLSTGESIWEYPISGGLDRAITSDASNNAMFGAIPDGLVPEGSFIRLDFTALANTFCRNEILGSVSADSDRIYAIAGADIRTPPTVGIVPGRFVSSRSRQAFQGTRLVALEKTTGRRVWTVGNAAMQEVAGADSIGFWIAGPPTVSHALLYGVVEWNGEILLTCFAPATGEVKWTKVLAFPEQTIDKDPSRQMRSARPAVESGLIWCPTTTGRIVCVDELTRTVVWAGFLPVNTEKQNRYVTGRGRPVALTPTASVTRRWAQSGIVQSADTLAVFSPRSHEIFLIDALTGHRRESISVSASASVIHADSSHVVIGEPAAVYCLATDSGRKVWSFSIPETLGTPAGRGALRNGHLLIPFSSGTILTVDLRNGTTKDTAENVLPGGAWGQLLTISNSPDRRAGNGDLLYAAPERLIRISDRKPEEKTHNAIELASGLMASGQWQQALTLVKQIAPADPAYREAEQARFDCLLQLAIRSPETWLAELRDVSVTDDQKIQVRFLEVDSQLKNGNYAQAASLLVDVLKLNSTLAAVPAPVAKLRSKSESDNSDRLPITVPLRSWAGAQLSRLLKNLPDDSAVWEQLENVPATSLLSLRHPGVRPLLRQAAAEESSTETALHLIRHSTDLASPDSAGEVEEEVKLLTSLLNRDWQKSSTAIETARSLLLNIALLEFPEAVVQQLRHMDTKAGLTDHRKLDIEFQDQLILQTEKWKPQPFEAIPVTRASSPVNRNTIALFTAEGDDPFLRTFRWSAIRGEYGRLLARSIDSEGHQWSVPGTYKVYGNYSNRTDTLYRLGSVVLLRSFSSIAAVSVMDRTVLWSRDFLRRGVVTSVSSPDGGFEKFVGGRHRLPAEKYYRYGAVRVAGTGHRWICLKHGDSVEVIDTLMGSTLWSTRLADTNSLVTATDDVVIISPISGDAVCLDRMTGQQLDIQDAKQLARRAIRNVGPLLVCWKSQSGTEPSSVEWINPLTHKVVRAAALEKMTYFRLLDDRMLAGFNDQYQMTVVDLVSTAVQTCVFQVNKTQPPSAGEKAKTEGDSSSGLPFWNSRRIRIAADGLNFYLTNAPENDAVPFRQPSGRELMRFEGEIRAVDRRTGNIRWRIANDGKTLVSTDQPELPVLIGIDSKPPAANGLNQTYTHNLFRAINKLTGDRLFSEVIPSRFGLRYLNIRSPKPGVVDVAVYGNQVRIQGTASVSVKQQQQ